MRPIFDDVVERGRITSGDYASPRGARYGAFFLFKPPASKPLKVIASDGTFWEEAGLALPAWEHVSVSLPDRCPTWEEMCWVKALFFLDEECAIQFHPPEGVRVNRHNFCLHLWRLIGGEFPLPPREAV